MSKWIIVLLLSFWAGVVNAQEFAIINDPDGYANVRDAKRIKAKIVGKLYSGQVFYYNHDKATDKWYSVYCNPGNYIKYPEGRSNYSKYIDIRGFVSANRILPMASMSHPDLSVKNRKIRSSLLTINWDTLILNVKTRQFQRTAHKIIGDKAVPALEIDGKHPYGRDGGIPQIEISGISLTIGRRVVNIPAKAFNDLYEPTLANWNIYHDKKDTYYIMSSNSDGAGGYDVVFVIKNGKFVGRYIDSP